MPGDALFTREEALAGQPLKKARTLLFLIEAYTAQGMARSAEEAAEVPLSQQEAERLDQSFWEAFAQARKPPIRPAIQDLERFSSEWASQVPATPALRAALAHLLGEKYAFTRELVPGLRAALGLDQAAVQQAYHRFFQVPLDEIYQRRISPLARVQWLLASFARWVEALPPFWIVFFLTLTRTIGVAILALPIAVARVGPLVGIGFVIMLGLLNALTTVAYGNASVRSGTVRYRRDFFGRMVADYLGEGAYRVFMGVLVLRTVLTLLTLYLAVSTTLADVLPVPAAVWVGVLLFVGLSMVWRQSFRATLSFALVVGVVTVLLILGLVALAIPHIHMGNLLYVRMHSLRAGSFDPALVQLIFGVILTAYSGHGAINNSARMMLRRDPSGRAIIWGAAAAQLCVLVLYIPWILAVNGVIPPSVLAAQSATVLAPLAQWVGPGVLAVGAAFAVLSLGLKSIYSTLALARQVGTILPTQVRQTLTLAARSGQVIGRPRSRRSETPIVGLAYLGRVDGRPTFRLEAQFDGRVRRRQVAFAAGEQVEPFNWLPAAHRRTAHLALVLLNADDQAATVQIDSPMEVRCRGGWRAAGLRSAELLDLPRPQRQLLTWMMRQKGVTLAEVVAHTGGGERSARSLLDTLLDAGLVREAGRRDEVIYQAALASRRASSLSAHIWQRLGESVADPAAERPERRGAGAAARRMRGMLLSERGGRAAAWGAVIAVGALTVGLLLTGRDSFTETVAFTGLLFTFQAGILPVLVFIASQHKGEWPGGVGLRALNHPVVTAGIYVVFLSSIFLHGLVIWQNPWLRAAALLGGLGVIVLSVLIQPRAMAPRIVVELRRNRGGEGGMLKVMADGRPLVGEARAEYAEGPRQVALPQADLPGWRGLREVTLDLPAQGMRELKVWAHQETPAGDLEPMPVRLEVRSGDWAGEFVPHLADGQVLASLAGERCWIRMVLEPEGLQVAHSGHL